VKIETGQREKVNFGEAVWRKNGEISQKKRAVTSSETAQLNMVNKINTAINSFEKLKANTDFDFFEIGRTHPPPITLLGRPPNNSSVI